MNTMQWCQPFPDEMLSSFITRQVISSGYPSLRIAEKQMWGNDNLQINTDFPSLIPWVARNYNLEPEYLAKNHTPLNYFKPFLNQKVFSKVKNCLLMGDIELLNKWIGRTSNRLTELDKHFYCPLCIEHDLQQYGVAYWHRVHQLYGVIICPTHLGKLEYLTVRRRGLKLPPQVKVKHTKQPTNYQQSFYKFSQWLLNQNNIERFDLNRLINCYRLALFDKELACNSLKIRQRKLRADLKSKYHNELQFKL